MAKREAHVWWAPKGFPHLVHCVNCGHLPLRNRISVICTNAGCGYRDDPQYKAWVARGKKFADGLP